MAVDIGRIAFETFYAQLYPTSAGTLITWENVGQKEQDAWRHAAVAVLQQIDREKEDANLNED